MTTQTTGSTPDTTQSTTNEKDSLQSGTIKGTQLVETIKIEDSPFTILKWDDKYYLTLGKYRLTEALETEEQAKEEINNVSWWRILQVMHIVVKEEINEHRQQKGGTNL